MPLKSLHWGCVKWYSLPDVLSGKEWALFGRSCSKSRSASFVVENLGIIETVNSSPCIGWNRESSSHKISILHPPLIIIAMEQTLQILTPSRFLPFLPFLLFLQDLGCEYRCRSVFDAWRWRNWRLVFIDRLCFRFCWRCGRFLSRCCRWRLAVCMLLALLRSGNLFEGMRESLLGEFLTSRN